MRCGRDEPAGNVGGSCHVVEQSTAGARPLRQVPQLGGEFGGVVVVAVQHPHPRQHLRRQVSSRLSGRSQTPSRSSPNLFCCSVVRNAARVRASMPTLVITNVVHVPSHDRSCGLIASS